MKFKALSKPFSFNELVETCEKEGWEIPSSKDIENQKFVHDEFWISDKIEDFDEIVDTHAHINTIGSDGNYMVANRDFILKAVVIDKPCVWKGTDEYGFYMSGCGKSFATFEGSYHDNGMIYCPFCGKLIEESA